MKMARNLSFLLLLFTVAVAARVSGQPQCSAIGSWQGYCQGYICEEEHSWCNNDGWSVAESFCNSEYGTSASSITECREEEPSSGVCQIEFQCWAPE